MVLTMNPRFRITPDTDYYVLMDRWTGDEHTFAYDVDAEIVLAEARLTEELALHVLAYKQAEAETLENLVQ